MGHNISMELLPWSTILIPEWASQFGAFVKTPLELIQREQVYYFQQQSPNKSL